MYAFTTKQQELIDEAIETHLNVYNEDENILVLEKEFKEIQDILWKSEVD